MNAKFILLSLVGIIFLAGCTLQPAGPTGKGVVIDTFSASPMSDIDPSTSVLFTLVVQNQGSEKATGVKATLMGLTDEWINEGENALDIPVDIGELQPADPSRGIDEGEKGTADWEYKPPAKDVKISYDATVRVEYTYAAKAEALIRAVSSDYYRQTQTRGGIQSSQSSSGPLSITVKAPNTVISSGGYIPVQVEIINIGDGRVYKHDGTISDDLDEIVVSVTSAGTALTGCDSKTVRLVGGNMGLMNCKLNTGTPTTYKDLPVSVSTNFNYFIDKTIALSVLKQIGFTETTGGTTEEITGEEVELPTP